MKTTRILSAAVVGFALLAYPARAQYKVTSDDGIAASPRVRLQLDERKAMATRAVAAAPAMSCSKCKEAFVSKPDTDPKGLGAKTLMSMGAPTKPVATHLCPGCRADWAVVGQGKAKQSVASHKCDACGSEDLACCNIVKGSTVATKGMEKFYIAPIK